jgi:hypothetical protein
LAALVESLCILDATLVEINPDGGHEITDNLAVNIDIASVFEKQDHLLMLLSVPVPDHDVQSVVVR